MSTTSVDDVVVDVSGIVEDVEGTVLLVVDVVVVLGIEDDVVVVTGGGGWVEVVVTGGGCVVLGTGISGPQTSKCEMSFPVGLCPT